MKLLQGTQETFLFSQNKHQQYAVDSRGGTHAEQLLKKKRRISRNISDFSELEAELNKTLGTSGGLDPGTSVFC